MRKDHILIIFCLLIVVLISGCVSQQITREYVCPDGSVVSDPTECATTTTTITTTTTTTTLLPCDPCFSYFTYLDHGSDIVYLRNGPQKISIGLNIYNPDDKIEAYHLCIKSPCYFTIDYKEFASGLSRNDSATLHGSITEIPCKPCFSYFSFVDYRPGILRIKNGQRNIMISSVTGGTAIHCTAESCDSGDYITITGIETEGDVQIEIDYIDVKREFTYSDIATIHNV
jgi:hypothetical protein